MKIKAPPLKTLCLSAIVILSTPVVAQPEPQNIMTLQEAAGQPLPHRDSLRTCLPHDFNIDTMTCKNGRFDFVTLPRVHFHHDEATLSDQSRRELDTSAVYFLFHLDRLQRIFIDGLADARGSLDYNYELSVKRAQTVKDYLTSRGIPEQLLHVTGVGEETPIDENWKRSGRTQNRTVTLHATLSLPSS